MKKMVVKAASTNFSTVKMVVAHLAEIEPVLRKVVERRLDPKEALMEAVDSIDLPYLGLDFNEPDSFTFDDLLEEVVYHNANKGENDYIFFLSVDGKTYINNIDESVDL